MERTALLVPTFQTDLLAILSFLPVKRALSNLTWFVKEVADNRRKGDADKDKALLAEVFKLLGNSAYGKFIEAVERQNRTLYTCNEKEVDKHLRSSLNVLC